MLKEFKNFILRGNVLDLAVGVIIGAAFTALVKSLVDNLINPLIGMFVQSSAFVLIKFINKLFPKKEDIVEEQKNEELETLQEIRDLLKK